MAKYRVLNIEELKTFEKEFIDFLVVNGIDAGSWETIKKNEPIKAEKVLEGFSDVVFESIYRKTMFLDFVSKRSIKSFQFLEKEIVLVGIDVKSDSEIEFNAVDSLEDQFKLNFNQLEVYQSRKDYNKQRELEMFDMVQNGAMLSKGELFKQIGLLF